MSLTTKNKQAIDLYLSEDPECKGNGTAAWMRVYGTKRRETASASWARMLGNVSAQAYMSQSMLAIEKKRRELIAYDKARYMKDLLECLECAMSERTFVGGDSEPMTVPGTMENLGEARRIAFDLYAAETGNTFPNKANEGMRVSINIDLGDPPPEPVEVTSEPKLIPFKPSETNAQKGRRPRVVSGKRCSDEPKKWKGPVR